MIYAHSSAPVGFGLKGRIREFVAAIKTARARRAAFDRAYSELQTMDDRELRDLGLIRSDFVYLAEAEADKTVPR